MSSIVEYPTLFWGLCSTCTTQDQQDTLEESAVTSIATRVDWRVGWVTRREPITALPHREHDSAMWYFDVTAITGQNNQGPPPACRHLTA